MGWGLKVRQFINSELKLISKTEICKYYLLSFQRKHPGFPSQTGLNWYQHCLFIIASKHNYVNTMAGKAAHRSRVTLFFSLSACSNELEKSFSATSWRLTVPSYPSPAFRPGIHLSLFDNAGIQFPVSLAASGKEY